MNGRLYVLLRLVGRGAVRKLAPVLGALGVLAVPMLAARWTGSNLELWGVPFKSAGECTREEALEGYLREFLSWWWMVVGLAYLLPTVLIPVAASYSGDQVLWLRLTPCSARELALARTGRVLAPLLILAGIGVPFAYAVSAWHAAPPRAAVWTVGGMLAHGLLAGGIVVTIGPLLRAPVDRAMGAFGAFLAPLIAFLAFVALEPKLARPLREWWPFTVPFAELPTDPRPHALAAAGLGAAGLVLSVLIQPGHRRRPAAAPALKELSL